MLDLNGPFYYHRVFVELGRLPRLHPAAGTAHVGDADVLSAGVDAAHKFVNFLRLGSGGFDARRSGYQRWHLLILAKNEPEEGSRLAIGGILLHIGQKSCGFNSRNIKRFSTTRIAAPGAVIEQDHIALAFGEAGAVPLVAAGGQPVFFTADEPTEFELLAGAAVRTTELSRAGGRRF